MPHDNDRNRRVRLDAKHFLREHRQRAPGEHPGSHAPGPAVRCELCDAPGGEFHDASGLRLCQVDRRLADAIGLQGSALPD